MQLLAHLNEPQRQAVCHLDGPVVVFAGAGSGKTRVITHRIAYLSLHGGVAPWSILAMTFTNKAAREMRQRLLQLMPEVAEQPWVGTFHAMCARLLRRYAEPVGIRADFTIYDDDDQRSMLRRVLRDLQLDERRYPLAAVAGFISRAKSSALSPDEVEPEHAYGRVLQNVYRAYEERMRLTGALDFGDILFRMVRAVEASPALRAELVRRFRHVMVDEFQDTNHVQYRLIKALCEEHRSLCVVGDDDQSIYRWRGADRHHMLQFRREFPDAKLIKLEQNYRSTACILRVANAVIAHNRQRETKRLWTTHADGDRVQLRRCRDERHEAALVVQTVRQLCGSQTVQRSDIAVLYRIHAQSRVLEEALRGSDIPYRIVGGMRFYDRAEVRDALAYLRLLNNPDDDASFLRIVNSPPRGIGKTTLDGLLQRATARGESVWQATCSLLAGDAGGLRPAAKRSLQQFCQLIERLRGELQAGVGLALLGESVLVHSGTRQKLVAEDTAEADTRLQNLQELLSSLQEFARDHQPATLTDFLEHVTLQTEVEQDQETERVTLMTVHAAKGLEFKMVWVAGLEERLFPYQNSEAAEDPESLEEERRLLYVAMTRAERRLILSYATTRQLFGQLRLGVPSRFLQEVPSEDIDAIGFETPSSLPPPVSSSTSYIDTDEASESYDSHLRPGMRVRHARFGMGRVLTVNEGLPSRATVDFPGQGRRQIVVDFLSPA